MSEARIQPMTGLATPTPWSVGHLKNTIVRDVPDLCDGHDCYRVASADVHGLLPLSEAKANAALIVEAVNSYASLKARIQVLEEALKPFACIALQLVDTLADDKKNTMHWAVPTAGQLRDALAALNPEKAND